MSNNRQPKLIPVRTYNQIVDLMTRDVASRISQRKQPEFTLGEPSKRMRRLGERLARARRELEACTNQLQRLGAEYDHGRFSLHYRRKNVLQTQWKAQQQSALDKVQMLKLQALVDLTGADPQTAKKYLTNLRTRLGRL